MVERMSSRKSLIKALSDEIEYETYRQKSFNGCIFSPLSDGTIEIETPSSDIIFQNISNINEQWLKVFCNKSSRKSSAIKKKPRKKKKFDIILNEFMEYLHTKKCVVDGCTRTNIEAHHILGRQPHRYDILCVPLCTYHHRGSEFSWHEGNVSEFRQKYTKDILSRIAMKIMLEWLDECSTIDRNVNENMLRFIAEKIIKTGGNVSKIIKDAILEYENEYLMDG